MYALVKNGKVVAKGSKRDMTSKMKKEGGKIFNAPSKKGIKIITINLLFNRIGNLKFLLSFK